MFKHKKILIIIAVALIIKLGLFVYLVTFAPQGKFLPDSTDYLKTAQMIASKGVFALENNGVLTFETYRTPGYPFFLAVFHYLLRIPLEGILLIQILLAVLVALIVYKSAFIIDKRIALLASLIILFSLPISIFSLQILGDILNLFLLSMFMFLFMQYLESRRMGAVLLSAVFLAAATYVRPVSYYFCLAAAVFIIYATIRAKSLKGIMHALIFLAVSYGLIFLWQLRNYFHFHKFILSSIQQDYRSFPIFDYYAKGDYFLGKDVPIFFSYLNAAWNCFLSLMTRPGTLKYLGNPILTVISKIFGYPFVVFWWIGLLAGLSRIKSSIYYQFLAFMMSYFIFITIAVVARSSGERYSLPIIPLIAIISSAGWVKLRDIYLERKRIRSLQQ